MHRYDRQWLVSLPRAGFSRTRSVRFQDVDAAGVIFYPVLFEYCHDLYVEFLAANDTPLNDVLRQGSWAAPIRHAEADYIAPLRFGDPVSVELCCAHLEATEVTLGFRLRMCASEAKEAGTVEPGSRIAGSRIAAVAQTVHTFVSLPDFKRCDVPGQLVDAFRDLGS